MRTNCSTVLLGVSLWLPCGAGAQQPPPSPPAQSSSTSQQSSSGKQGKYANHIVLSGTVFTAEGLALPGAQVRVRRAGEKKVLAESVSNRAGEFWMHVPGGVEYEMTVKAQGFEEQKAKLEAGVTSRQDIVFRMKAVSGGKKK